MLALSDVRALGQSLSNWGRWGADDERGTLNLITAECVREAGQLIRTGQVVRCGLNYDDQGPFSEAVAAVYGRFNARLHVTHTGNEDAGNQGLQFSDDVVQMPMQTVTQWDALAHVHYDGVMYNGRPSSLITDAGAAANSIEKIAEGIIGRGVLLDVARRRGLDQLPDDGVIYADELEGCAKDQGVEIRSGDILLVRTGSIGRQRRDGWVEDVFALVPGLGLDCARWLHDRQIAAVACDCATVEAHPTQDVADCVFPLHQICLRDMGMTFGEFFDLEELSAVCQRERRWDFFFVGAPLPVTGAVGSPVNPLAVF